MNASRAARRIGSLSAVIALVVVGTARAQETQGRGEDVREQPSTSQSTIDEDTDDVTIVALFGGVGRDLRGVIRGEPLKWLVAGGALSAGAILLDDEIASALQDQNPDDSLAAGDSLGEAYVHVGVPLALYVTARLIDHHGAASLGSSLLRAQVVNGILTRSLKLLPRRRPNHDRLSFPSGSFPSGHTSAAFATATVLQRRFGWRIGLPSYIAASYVGVTRLQNTHYFSDVMFGAALCVASAVSVPMPARMTMSPMLAPGTVGVTLEVRR